MTLAEEFDWKPVPAASALMDDLLEAFFERSTAARDLSNRLATETGTRLPDWIDHLWGPVGEGLQRRLIGAGFAATQEHGSTIWAHPHGLLPRFVANRCETIGAMIKVESVADFLVANRLDVAIEGRPLAPLRKARIAAEQGSELWIIERHSLAGFDVTNISPEQAAAVLWHQEAFRRRRRHFPAEEQGFEHAQQLLAAASKDLGIDRACDLLFAAEREYWQSRNRAARVQKARQDALGLGWANHDHHTYRSSRECFSLLIATLEKAGFQSRERFYGGRQAGWGAQILEQPACGIVVFADVDLAPEEVSGDFAHEGLAPRTPLGTVGLWCKLHGEAFLEAGMHHLECRFDFDGARRKLQEAGVQTMKPFTDFPYLKQAFTEGEIWPVAPARIEEALAMDLITPEQAEQFRRHGALGSHLEVLQRDDGYKGFNQTGISEIIRKTDPRRSSD
jgi:hypothetical protein